MSEDTKYENFDATEAWNNTILSIIRQLTAACEAAGIPYVMMFNSALEDTDESVGTKSGMMLDAPYKRSGPGLTLLAQVASELDENADNMVDAGSQAVNKARLMKAVQDRFGADSDEFKKVSMLGNMFSAFTN